MHRHAPSDASEFIALFTCALTPNPKHTWASTRGHVMSRASTLPHTDTLSVGF